MKNIEIIRIPSVSSLLHSVHGIRNRLREFIIYIYISAGKSEVDRSRQKPIMKKLSYAKPSVIPSNSLHSSDSPG